MEKPRIQDDLYLNVNQDWLETAEIPADRPTAGGFADLDKGVEELLIKDFKEMLDSGKTPNVHMENAIKMFGAIMDTKKRNRQGFKPAVKAFKKFLNLKDLKALNRKLTDISLSTIALPFSIGVDVDMKDSLHHCLMIQGASTILPDTIYYKPEMEAQRTQLFAIWSSMVKQILLKTGLDEANADLFIKDAIEFDAGIAKYAKSSEEWSDYPAIYNPYKGTRVCSMVKPFKLKKALINIFGEVPEKIIVTEPRYFKNFKEIFDESKFEQYKHWAYIKAILGVCNYLSEEARELGSTYSRALSGVVSVPKIDVFAYHLAGGYFSQPVGLYYGEKYFGPKAKKDVVEMVEEIIATYKKRVARNTFLSEETKKKAIVKLDAMKIKMGYPDKIDEIYDKLVYNPELSLLENILEFKRILTLDSISYLKKDVDRSKWVMPGHMVNACYNPTSNDITFPAAILQAPFYSIKQTRSQNLGGIGAVIGHEISHAFDNNGAKCDENGNLNNWWTKEDMKNFNQKTKAMAKEFDGIELPQGKVNGKFIVSENIADNGGMACTLEIMSGMKDANYQEYFINWAKVWCLKAKPEYLELILKIDVHAPAVLRANMQPRNFEEWYKAFDVKKTDKMYLAPNKRVVIW